MNNVYFICHDCKQFVDAGYRWAAWELTAKDIVAFGQRVNVERVLSAETYWQVPDDVHVQWLSETLVSVRQFLNTHQTHHLTYNDDDDKFRLSGQPSYFDWLEIGEHAIDHSPRTFIEKHGMTTWAEVEQYIATTAATIWWWRYEPQMTWAKQKFTHLVEETYRRKR